MIINLTKNKIIARAPISAISVVARGRGMIGRDFKDFDAMVFGRCNSIHTMFMSIKIDVLFVDRENIICDFRSKLPPWRPFIRCGKAVTVIELPEGTVEDTGIGIGDLLDLNAELTKEQNEKLTENLLPVSEAGVVAQKAAEG